MKEKLRGKEWREEGINWREKRMKEVKELVR